MNCEPTGAAQWPLPLGEKDSPPAGSSSEGNGTAVGSARIGQLSTASVFAGRSPKLSKASAVNLAASRWPLLFQCPSMSQWNFMGLRASKWRKRSEQLMAEMPAFLTREHKLQLNRQRSILYRYHL